MKIIKKLLLLVCIIPISNILGMEEKSFTTKTLSEVLGNFPIKTNKENSKFDKILRDLMVKTTFQNNIIKSYKLYLNPLVESIEKQQNPQLIADYKKKVEKIKTKNKEYKKDLVDYKNLNNTLRVQNTQLNDDRLKLQKMLNYAIPIFGIGGLLVGGILAVNLYSLYYNPNPSL